MAELIVRVVDKAKSGDVYIDAQRWQKGDVLAIVPDGWEWSKAERENPEWLIVKLPGVKESDLSMLMNQEPGDRMKNRMLRLRSHHLDVDAIRLGINPQKVIMPKKSLRDPNVIG